MQIEIWKPIHTDYEVSNLGRVRKNGKLKKLSTTKTGYLITSISRVPRMYKLEYVHRLVAEAFIGPPASPEMDVNHLDGNKQNNTPSNLEWTTRKQNIRHAFAMGLNKVFKRLSDEQIDTMYQRYLEGGVTQAELAALYGVSEASISRYIKNAKSRFTLAN